MKHQTKRMKFRHAAPRSLYRGPAAAAAFLAVAAAGGVLLTQTPGQAEPKASSVSTTILAGSVREDAAKASRSQDRTVTAPAQSSAPRPVAPSTPAPSAPAAPAAASSAPAASTSAPAPSMPAQPPVPTPPVSKVLTYDYQRQPNYYYCGPATTRIVLSASGHTFTQDQVARLLGTTTSGTDSADDATRVLNSIIDGKPYQTRSVPTMAAAVAQAGQVRADIVQAISSGYAVVANIVHSATDTNGVTHTYDGGHYVAVVGYKDSGQTVKIADPANPNGDGTYWVDATVMAKWMATHGYSF